jgi:hypothetical protein
MNKKAAARLTGMTRFFRYWMPYTFTKLEVNKRKHVYLPLNRNYKPLGVLSLETVDYDK